MNFDGPRSYLSSGEDDPSSELGNSGTAYLLEIEKDWRREVRPAMEDVFDDDKEYVFHPETIAYQTGLPTGYVEKCMIYYLEEMEQEGFTFREESTDYWILQRF